MSVEKFSRKGEKILIYGAGSIGVFLGATLFQSGYEVTLYGRRKLKRLHDSILINGKLYNTPPRTLKLKDESHYDVIFVTTKLYDSALAMKDLRRKNIKWDIIVFIQNGLVEENFYGDYRNHPGFVTVSVFEGYRLIENQLLATKSGMGWQTENNSAGQKICDILQSADINCSTSDDLNSIRAEKMILVNAVGALSALEKKTIGELVVSNSTKDIVGTVIDESYAVLHDDYNLAKLVDVKKRFYKTISQVKTHYSSMYQDITSGRKTEIEYLNGLIVRLGEKKGISTPVNKKIYKKIKLLEARQ